MCGLQESDGTVFINPARYIYICQHIGRRLSSQHVDQAFFEIMVNISQHDNHVSQQMPADMTTAQYNIHEESITF